MSIEQHNIFIVGHGHQSDVVRAIRGETHLSSLQRTAAPTNKRGAVSAPPSRKARASSSGAKGKKRSERPREWSVVHNDKKYNVFHFGSNCREWSVLHDDKKYNVFHMGRNCGYLIELDGSVVWIGVRALNGAYETHSTSLTDEVLEPLLRLVKTGDDRDAAKRGERAAPTKKEGKAATAGPPTMRAAEVFEATKPASVKPASVKPASSKATKPSSKHVAETVVEAPARVSSKEPKPSSKHVPEAAKPASKKAAKPSSKRAKAPSKAPAREIKDKTIFKEMERKLKRENAENPEEQLNMLKRIWLHGGREATLAWMSGEGSKFKSVVNAFDKWAESHPAEVEAILDKSQEAPTSAKAA